MIFAVGYGSVLYGWVELCTVGCGKVWNICSLIYLFR